MQRRWWLFLLLAVMALAACSPVQIGLEPGTTTAVAAVTSTVRAEATVGASATPEPSATRTPRATAVVSTVTASPTQPATDTHTPEPPTPTFTATRPPATATPSATMPIVDNPAEITSFTVDRAEADLGEQVTLTWSTQNSFGLQLQTGVANADGLFTWSTVATGLPPSGTQVVTFGSVAPAQLFRLETFNALGLVASSRDLGVARRNCPETYAFPFPADRFECAADPSTLASMAEQAFERGRLVWLEANNWINPRSQPIIFVITNAGTWVSRSDDFVAGEPESDPALVPPDGLHQPVGSFGKLWRNEMRETLGWALAPEVRYTGAVQQGWNPMSNGVGGWSYFAQDIYLRLSGSGVLRLVWSSRFTGQTWETILP